MKTELKRNSVNQIIKGTVIYEKGDVLDSLALIVKGKVSLQTETIKMTVGSGYFLGILDLDCGVHNAEYTAETNAVIYPISAEGLLRDVNRIQGVNKDYGMLMVSGLGRNICDLAKLYRELERICQEAYDNLQSSYRKCQAAAEQAGVDVRPVARMEKLQPYQDGQEVDSELLEYFLACSKVPREVQTAYYGTSVNITAYHVKRQLDLIRQMDAACRKMIQNLKELLDIAGRDSVNLFQYTAKVVTALQRMGESNSKILSEIDTIIDWINQIETVLVEKVGLTVEIDRNAMEDAYFKLLNPSRSASSVKTMETEDDMVALVEHSVVEAAELTDILDTLIEYSQIDSEEGAALVQWLEKFQALPDKASTADSARRIRKEICRIYYPMYEKIFLREYASKEDTPIEVELFLRYGLLSEKLVTLEVIEELIQLDNSYMEDSFCQVYDMKEWLTEILEGRKEPSKNEFDMNYDEYLRDQKKRGEITQKELTELQRDNGKKLEFEINNLFRNNHRLVSGQISIFVPFLYTEGLGGSLLGAFLSKDKVNGAVNRIRKIDYSAFYRSSLYKTEQTVFQKEYIMEEVGPDIIVFPAYGGKGVMWQDLGGPQRNSRGRFLFPIFFEGDLERMIIQVIGAFRWELCRTMQGVYWNNIQIRSLTSEYSDFLQFYKKNKDLSEDRKEKLRLQIQKHRNNNREVFVSDYDSWIRHEAKGGMVLSKPVREIMATYCPFNRQIREGLGSQPLFREAAARFQRETAKKQKEYDMKFRVWDKDGISVPEEILETRKYYQEY